MDARDRGDARSEQQRHQRRRGGASRGAGSRRRAAHPLRQPRSGDAGEDRERREELEEVAHAVEVDGAGQVQAHQHDDGPGQRQDVPSLTRATRSEPARRRSRCRRGRDRGTAAAWCRRSRPAARSRSRAASRRCAGRRTEVLAHALRSAPPTGRARARTRCASPTATNDASAAHSAAARPRHAGGRVATSTVNRTIGGQEQRVGLGAERQTPQHSRRRPRRAPSRARRPRRTRAA